jgi:hypothetical protein
MLVAFCIDGSKTSLEDNDRVDRARGGRRQCDPGYTRMGVSVKSGGVHE